MLKPTNFSLFLSSFLVLFLELLIIRLVGTEIRIFAYLSNLTLLAVFVGSGIGMLLKRKIPLEVTSITLFLLTVALTMQYIVRLPRLDFELFSGITELLSPLADDYIWLQLYTVSKTGLVIGFSLTVLLVLLIILIFIPIGQYIGEIFKKDRRPLFAYSVNILASVAGMWAFYVVSLLRFPPVLGILLSQLLLLFLLKTQIQKYLVVALVAATIALTLPTSAVKLSQGPIDFWSLYQKLTLMPSNPDPLMPKGYYLQVNNTGYMSLADLGQEYRDLILKELEVSSSIEGNDWQFTDLYSLPYTFNPQAKSVLIIGAGAGNDAAAAIRAKIPSIDAVEIDPLIIEIGQKFHPERPYGPSVSVFIDDGRAYYTRTDKKYDIIIMGLADSHTLGSALTNLRLDNYLYTVESLTQAKQLLSDNGILFLNFEVKRPWMGGHLKETLKQSFGHEPKVFEVRSHNFFGNGGFAFVISKNPEVLDNQIRSVKGLTKYVESNSRQFPAAEALTDSWPYLYSYERRIPTIHLVMAVILIGLLLISRSVFMVPGKFRLDFFFLGAAFLLYEFQNVTKTSLLFGTTWITNLFTITSILLFILLANYVVANFRPSQRSAYLFLALSLILQIIFPVAIFNTLEFWPKVFVSSAFLNLPLFFAAIIFAQKFAQAKDRQGALGSNLIGSAIGGLAEMLSFVFGIQALIIGSAAFYLLSYFVRGDE